MKKTIGTVIKSHSTAGSKEVNVVKNAKKNAKLSNSCNKAKIVSITKLNHCSARDEALILLRFTPTTQLAAKNGAIAYGNVYNDKMSTQYGSCSIICCTSLAVG